MKFYKCTSCKELVIASDSASLKDICCNESITEIIPGEVDAATEKHVPVITKKDNFIFVNVGSVKHPMLEKHFIEWIILETDKGFYKKDLRPGEEPTQKFYLDLDETPLRAYEYCNLHGLWVKEV